MKQKPETHPLKIKKKKKQLDNTDQEIGMFIIVHSNENNQKLTHHTSHLRSQCHSAAANQVTVTCFAGVALPIHLYRVNG